MFYKINISKLKVDYDDDTKNLFCVKERKRNYKVIGNAEDVRVIGQRLIQEYQDRDKEYFFVLGLDIKNKPKYVQLISMGTVSGSLVHPRETFRAAIYFACSSIVLIHNHPSGDCKPSDEDVRLTKSFVEAGKLLGISLIDHVVISEEQSYCSLANDGYL